MNSPKGFCAFCGKHGDLRLSHIFPACIVRYHKETGPTGYLRTSDNPSKRRQDGPKYHLLCGVCEQKFGKWENEYYPKLFLPYHRGSNDAINYRKWHLKCISSIAFRIIAAAIKNKTVEFPSQEQWELLDACMRSHWLFLNEIEETPRNFEVHLLPLETIKNPQDGLPPNINRYFLRNLEQKVYWDNDSMFIYIKICKFLYIIHLKEKDHRWTGTKVSVNNGDIMARKMYVNRKVWDMIVDGAKFSDEIKDRIPSHQAKKIDDTLNSNLDDFLKTETGRGFIADMEMRGGNQQ